MSAEDSEECRLDGFLSFSIQIIMGSFAFASLIIKWRQETPRRAPLIWLFDTLKQGSGLLLQHFTNLLFSIIAGQYLHQNSCAWYMCSHIVDSIVGVFCCWILHSFLLRIVSKYQPRFDRLRSGEYGDPISLFTFFMQLNTWWTIISLSKIVVFPLLWLLRTPIFYFMDIILQPLESHPNIKLFTVLFLVPVIVNTIIFWIQDEFLRMTEKRRQQMKQIEDEQQQIREQQQIDQINNTNKDKSNVPYVPITSTFTTNEEEGRAVIQNKNANEQST